MITILIEYYPSAFDPENRYEDPASSPPDGTVAFTELMEAIAGEVFQEELDHVDVRLYELTRRDETSFPMMITVDGDTTEVRAHDQRSLMALADQFHAAVEDRCRMFPTGSTPLPEFRVWVRSQPGAVSDPARMKGNG